ncbi:MAG TPA: biopolymer transporter ExbD, partial [Alphaproteobacteria bacterium]|nr:biopolymer transporter ExbD [Alphaproteobacteria bacterium]
MAISVRNEGAKVNSNINVTPMVDVMLVMLIIFMVVTPMLQKGITVNLAQTKNEIDMKDANREDAITVAINKDGRIFLDTEVINEELLTDRVKSRISGKTDKKVYIKADARARYKWVVDVVDDVRSAGV